MQRTMIAPGKDSKEVVRKDYKYEYLCALCQAIEDYTNSQEAQNANAYIYRRANLKYAIQRELFFSFLNNVALYDFYKKWKQNNLPARVEFKNELELSMAMLLCDNSLPKGSFAVKKDWARDLAGDLFSILRFLRNYPRGLFWNFKRIFKERENARVVIYAVDEKFVRFLKPMTDALSVPFAYLLLKNARLKKGLFEKKVPYIDYGGMYVHSIPQARSRELNDFVRLVEYFDHVYECLKASKPGCVVVIEGNAPANELINQAGKMLSIPVVCIQQGWATFIHTGFRNMSYTKFLIWGAGFAKLLEPLNPDQKFVPVGNYIIEQEFSQDLSIRLNGKKGVTFFLQAPGSVTTKESWDLFLALIQWTAGSFSQWPVLLREHPSYALPSDERDLLLKYSNVYLVPSQEFSLSAVL